MAHRMVWVASLLLSQWGLSVGGNIELLPKQFSSPMHASEVHNLSKPHRNNANGMKTVETTLGYPSRLTASAPLQSMPQNQSMLPWVWIGAGAAMGVGIGAYILGKTGDARSPKLFYPPTPEPFKDPQGDRPVARIPGQASTQKQPLLPALKTEVSTVSKSVLAKSSKITVHSHPSKRTEKRSVGRLGHHQSSLKSVEKLVETLQSAEGNLRRQAIWDLGQQGAPDVIQPLVNSMATADSQQRSLILAALSEIGTRTLMPLSQALILALQDNNGDVRKNAIREITRLYMTMDQLNQILGHAMTDDDAEVRATAQWAFDQVQAMQARSNSKSVMPASHPRQRERQVVQDGIGDRRRRENWDVHA